jgi:pimeloyl-ACP methyl ester carboxylesterase
MQIATPFQSQGDEPDLLYEYRLNHRFYTGVSRRSRLLSTLIPCVTGIGCMYQAVATVWDQHDHPPPGTLVDIDGCRLHVQTAGRGFPSVVLETGLGGMSSAWGWIQPEAAKFSLVVAYDRAGLGWSGPDAAPKTATLAAERLRSVLLHSRVLPPYVLVGHSMGGLYIRVFADRYPNEVAGMVLLDASHPDQHLRSAAIGMHMRSGFSFLKAVPLLARLGYVRLTGLFNAWAEGLPERQAAEAEAFLSSYRHLKTTRDESLAWETICAEVRRTRGLGDTPLAVVTAGRDVLPGQPELQSELAALSSDSVHFVVKGADHVSLVTRREHALSVVEAIRHVVERANALRPGNKRPPALP